MNEIYKYLLLSTNHLSDQKSERPPIKNIKFYIMGWVYPVSLISRIWSFSFVALVFVGRLGPWLNLGFCLYGYLYISRLFSHYTYNLCKSDILHGFHVVITSSTH